MPVFNVCVTRLGIGFKTLKLVADTKTDAESMALMAAGDHEFTEVDAEYELTDSSKGLLPGPKVIRDNLENIYAIKIGYVMGCRLMAERQESGEWAVRHGEFYLREDLEMTLRLDDCELLLDLEDAISLGKSWLNRHMLAGADSAEEKLRTILSKDDFAVWIGLSSDKLYRDDPPGPKPVVFIYLRGKLTDEIQATCPKGGPWRFTYIENCTPWPDSAPPWLPAMADHELAG